MLAVLVLLCEVVLPLEDRNDGLEGAEGFELPEEEAALVAMAVGMTQEGESLPANPSLVNPVPLSITTAGVLMLVMLNCGL